VIVDVHAHALTEQAIARMQRESPEHAPRLVERTDDSAVLEVDDFRQRPFRPGAWDFERRLGDMDAAGVDMQALSVVVATFGYHLEPALATTFAQIQNEEITGLVRSYPDRFVGLATLPMQDPNSAAAELRRAVKELGLRGAEIGTNVAGRNLDSPELEPVWAAVEELGAFLFVHPDRVAAAERLSDYYLTNLLGNPLDTSIAIASLVFGGVLERYPRLILCFAHGGGFVPYQRGRLEHGWRVRAEPRQKLKGAPEASFQRLYYDTILHSPQALDYLVRTVGAEHVLLGSDYPFDMGPRDPVASVESAVQDADDRRCILGDTAARLLRLGE
jgi:aminocarboxymuconate-semialdehyde decarboxylase